MSCCPAKAKMKMIRVGNQDVGVSDLDEIVEKAEELGNRPEDEIKSCLLQELKLRNYVPIDAEREYVEALWAEFQRRRKAVDER